MNHIEQLGIEITDREFIATLLFFALLFFVRFLLVRAFEQISFKDDQNRRKWISSVKNITFIVIVFIFFMMWGKELRTLAFSLAAVAVAIVIAFKEIIMCFIGGLLKAANRMFEIGDRITIVGKRGEVMEHNLLSTTLLEIGPGDQSNQFTGKQIKIPNILLVTESIFVLPKGENYNLNVFIVPAVLDKNLFVRQEILLNATKAVSEPYFSLAEESIVSRSRKQRVRPPDLKPRVLYEIIDPKTVHFFVRCTMPFDSLTRTENKIKDMYLSECFKQDL
jgi:small-conductance mechanosensitive channel